MNKITFEDIKRMVHECISILENVDDGYDSSCSYIFCKNEENVWCILGGKRGSSSFSGKNLYNPPMGMKEYGENAVQCAVRECMEETGLSLPENIFTFINSEKYGDGKIGANFLVKLDGITSNYNIGEGDGENSRFEWIPVDSIEELQWAFGTDKTAIEIFGKYIAQPLEESTNMKSLYHFTSIYCLRDIAKSDELVSANYLKDYWDNNSHISLTRHRNNFEGFAGAHGKNKNVRIQFNVDRLNSRHDILTIKPMEFYSPQRHGKYTYNVEDPYASSKAYYHKPKNWDTDENGIEYHNQAEEGLQLSFKYRKPKLTNLHKYIDRIDILFSYYYQAVGDFEGWINVLAEYDEINDTAFAKYVPIFVYFDSNHFVLQNKHCVRLNDMISDLNKNYGNIKDIHSQRFDEFLGNLKNLEESELNEHTNMKSLYHFTTLTRFASIAGTNKLTSANYNNSYWDNNDHISLTRHKGDLEGFANAAFSRDDSIARIELNTDKLNSRHHVINIKPMEFYSPKRERFDAVDGRKIEHGKSGKERYQNKDYYYARQHYGGNNAIRGQLNRYARLEYQNQAEEGLQTKNSNIQNLSNYVNRVDIFYPNFQEMAMGFKNYQNILKSFSYILNTEFCNEVPIYIYDDRKHFILQDDNCITIQDAVTKIEKTKLNESKLNKIVTEVLDELSKQTLQNAASAAYRKGKWGEPDDRVKKFRQAAVDKHREEDKFSMYGNRSYTEDEQEQYITDNNGNKLIIFDSDYHSLQDLYNGVKQGKLLIHCRKVDENDIPDMLYPEFGETVQDAYGCEFPEDMEKPELLFASDNFNWANNYPKNRSGYTNKRNGVFFIDAENFEKSIGDGYVQTIDGQIYLNYDLPITVETDDWFSEEPANVAGVMIIK